MFWIGVWVEFGGSCLNPRRCMMTRSRPGGIVPPDRKSYKCVAMRGLNAPPNGSVADVIDRRLAVLAMCPFKHLI